jgi:hypothetical protein
VSIQIGIYSSKATNTLYSFLKLVLPNLLPVLYAVISSGTDGNGNLLPAEGNKYRDIWKQVPVAVYRGKSKYR